jgi:tRNA(fMet)-specific endonuclease VapC
MLRFLLDTNLCIRVLRDRTPSLREKFNLEAESLAISTIVFDGTFAWRGKIGAS